MKLVFCDIDGVLNSEIGTAESGVMGIEEDKLYLLEALLESTGAELVITSKARFAESLYKERLRIIERAGLRIRHAFEGRSLTPNPKSIEVLAYLQNKCGPVDRLVILDDNDHGFPEHFGPNFVKIDTHTGLTLKDMGKAIDILGSVEPTLTKRVIRFYRTKEDYYCEKSFSSSTPNW